LPISTGVAGLGTGVAAFLATPSAANLASAVTEETGSGSLVFATSPTLVTPALGTPSSVVLTNATSLPISTGVSGLGTGVATFLATPSSANLASAVTGETGSGGLVFATSPTIATPTITGVITGNKSGTNNIARGVILQRGALTITTTTLPATPTTANTQSVTWATEMKADSGMFDGAVNAALINIPITGVYTFTLGSRFGTGTAYAIGLYVFQNTTLKYHIREDASSLSTLDTIQIHGAIYAAAGDTLQVRVAASAASKTLVGATPAPQISVIYMGDWA
jgi:hypothetical protein